MASAPARPMLSARSPRRLWRSAPIAARIAEPMRPACVRAVPGRPQNQNLLFQHSACQRCRVARARAVARHRTGMARNFKNPDLVRHQTEYGGKLGGRRGAYAPQPKIAGVRIEVGERRLCFAGFHAQQPEPGHMPDHVQRIVAVEETTRIRLVTECDEPGFRLGLRHVRSGKEARHPVRDFIAVTTGRPAGRRLRRSLNLNETPQVFGELARGLA